MQTYIHRRSPRLAAYYAEVYPFNTVVKTNTDECHTVYFSDFTKSNNYFYGCINGLFFLNITYFHV
jgi:hypothetical protein